nr:N-acetylglucosamine-6-phosphate deacetylase [Petrachloros mirabilis]
MSLCLKNAQIAGYSGLQQVLIQSGQIATIQPQIQVAENFPCLDLGGDWLSLGGVDLQINGALGIAFTDLGAMPGSTLSKICRFLWEQGVDAYLPTLVTTSVDNIHSALAHLSQFQPEPGTAQILGAHLEGPFLNPAKQGAHPAEFLLPLTVTEVERVLGVYSAQVKLITLAPELDPTGMALAALRDRNIFISLGHSLATAEEAQTAFEQGATLVTHAFNAMPSLHHRQPGLLGAALLTPGIRCGVIADGEHIHPRMLQLLVRMAQRSGLFLVSDALAPLGLPDGTYPWDARTITIANGTARLADGTLAGTTLPLLQGVQNLVHWGICSVPEAIHLATEAPRQALNLPGLGPGQSLSGLLRWHLDAKNTLSWERLFSWPEDC